MATTQPVSITVGFDGAGNPATLSVVSQVTLTGGVVSQLPAVAYPLDAADKAALLATWNKVKGALGFP